MKAMDAANYLVYLLNGVCDDLTNMKINKLLYYAQGYYLQQHGVPLFDDRIEAWDHGPIVPSVYNQYKEFGKSPLTVWNQDSIASVSEEASGVLFEVAREYGKYTAGALRGKTHVPNGPWDSVYRKGERHVEIPLTLIRDYFTRPNAKRLVPLELDFADDDFVGYHDSDGTLVLPKEWDDEALSAVFHGG